MCLYVESFDSAKLFGEKKTITCYKILLVSNGWFTSPFYCKVYPDRGVVKSNRDEMYNCSVDAEKEYMTVDRGIHVYTSLAAAKNDIRHYSGQNCFVIIPVICERKDFVAVGADCDSESWQKTDAVFSKVRIHKRAKVLFKKAKTCPDYYK